MKSRVSSASEHARRTDLAESLHPPPKNDPRSSTRSGAKNQTPIDGRGARPLLKETGRPSPQAATLWHSSAQAWQASPQALHSAYCGNLSHSFLHATQTSATVLAIAGVKAELTAASDSKARHAAMRSKDAVVQAAMLESFMDSMPKQWRRQLSPSRTHFPEASLKAL